jgi:PBP4 family serine-type D-alanyl-D-alanine carboxypeptidase
MHPRSRLAVVTVSLSLVCLLPAALPAAAEDKLADRLERIMSRSAFRHAIFGVSIRSLDTGKVIYEKNADTFFAPASTTKLVTVGSALLVLGSDYRFHTRVYRTGEVGPDGVLAGDLVLVAAGDPNLSGRVRPDGTLAFENGDHSYGGVDVRGVPGDPLLVIRELARQVAARGIRRIAGRVIVDATLFPEGDKELGTGVTISPIVVNDNLIDVLAEPGAAAGDPVRLKISPATSFLRIVNQATTGKADSTPSVDYGSEVAVSDGSSTVTLTGSLPLGSKQIMIAYAVAEPHRYAESVLAEALQEQGVVARPALREDHPDWKALAASYQPERRVAEHVSPPLSAEAKVILKVSQNLHASMMPALLGALAGGKGEPAAGFKKMREALTKAGIDLDGAMQGDGAGGRALFTPTFMTGFLAVMAKEPFFAAYFDALPVLGQDGTLAKIQTGTKAAGHVHAKTGTIGYEDLLNGGTMLGGKGLAGYVTTVDGRRLAFALYVNNVKLGATYEVDPEAAQKVAGQSLGEMAGAAYDAPP